MAKINLTEPTISALNDILDKDVLENDIGLMEDIIDDYLMDAPSESSEDAIKVLDRIASLRMVSKQFSEILKTL
jgi:hypothetical protein